MNIGNLITAVASAMGGPSLESQGITPDMLEALKSISLDRFSTTVEGSICGVKFYQTVQIDSSGLDEGLMVKLAEGFSQIDKAISKARTEALEDGLSTLNLKPATDPLDHPFAIGKKVTITEGDVAGAVGIIVHLENDETGTPCAIVDVGEEQNLTVPLVFLSYHAPGVA